MKNRKAAQQTSRKVWRVSSQAPLGEVVEVGLDAGATADPGARRPEAANASEGREFGWRQSSLELSDGLEVNEDHDTIPADLWDDYFKP